MTRNEVIARLGAHREALYDRGISSLSVFGSFARDEARPDSDVDLLVEFDRPTGLFAFVRLKRYLEEVLGRRVDLVTPDAVRSPIRDQVLREAVRAA